MENLNSVGVDVSRETLEGLRHYQALLEKWNPAINLVAKSTLTNSWQRHFVDSAQIFSLAPENPNRWLDIGSGGGFPGMVCALLSKDKGYSTEFTFLESDKRKCVFLSTVSRELGLSVLVKSERIESAEPAKANVVTARALASLDDLFGFCDRHLNEKGTALFLKGEKFNHELDKAQENWSFDYEAKRSATNPEAVVLRIGDIKRARP